MADDVLTAPAWWPSVLALPTGAQVMRVDDDACEVAWMAQGLDLDAVAAQVTARAERAGWTVRSRSATSLKMPTPSVAPGFLSEDEVLVPIPLRRTLLRVSDAGATKLLALDEIDTGVVLGRYRFANGQC